MRGRKLLEGFLGSGQSQGAFNVFNAESIRAVVEAVIETEGYAFIQTSASTVKSYGAVTLGTMIDAFLNEEHRHRFLIHLDHCLDLQLIDECIRHGWDGVMIDASGFPLEENIERTRVVVEMAQREGVIVEGEIGYVGGPEDDFVAHESEGNRRTTSPEEIERFARETGVDLLAVGVGTKHGHYEPGTCRVDTELLRAVHRRCPAVPMVLHGGSGIPMDQVRAAVGAGVRKINISTDLKEAYLAASRVHALGPDPHAIMNGIQGMTAAMRGVVAEKIRAFQAMPWSEDPSDSD